MNATTHARPSGEQLSWLWLLIGVVLLPFTAYQGVVALAAWIAPAFLLRFARTSTRGRLALVLVFLAYVAAAIVGQRGSPIGSPLDLLIGLTIFPLTQGVVHVLPYVADRVIGRRLGTWSRLFVFPTAFVAIDWATSLLHATDTFGSPAYSQAGELVLLQIISITGMWGITFLIAWFASAVNAAWEHDVEWSPALRPLGAFALTLGLVLLFGIVRLGAHAAPSSTVQAATITIDSALLDHATSGIDLATFYASTDAQRAAVRPLFAATVDQMLARTETALRQGAKLVGWQEDSGQVLAEDVPATLARASALADRYHAYLQIELEVYARTTRLPYLRNESILIDDTGHIVATYEKSYPVFPAEWVSTFPGTGVLPIVDSPYGQLSTAICHDMSYPALLHQAGSHGVGILFAPTHSIFAAWAPSDAAEATYRTIENGFVLVRATGNGPSLILDPEGRVIASQDYFASDNNHIQLASVPTRGVTTIYGRFGDWFAYLCLLVVAGLTGWAFVRGRAPIAIRHLQTA
jgi:apolipoprotein N-acyltransferase